MDLTPFVSRVQEHLALAAAAGGDEARELAGRLTAPLDSAMRLTLLEALSAAANEITVELAPGSVDVRLRGGDPEFVVATPTGRGFDDAVERPSAPDEPWAAEAGSSGEGGTTRTTLRLPEHLKQQVEDAAARQGLSVNAWLIRAVSQALRSETPERRPGPGKPGGQSYTGWAR
jgi:hypothetical protein